MSAAKFTTAIFALAAMFGLSSCSDIKSPTFQPRLLELKVCEQPDSGVCPTDGAQCNARLASSPTLIPVNRSAQFCALGRYEVLQEFNDEFSVSSEWRDVAGSVMWTSGDNAALVVNETGLATGRQETPAVLVNAELSDQTASSVVQVTAPALESVDISPNNAVETLVTARLQYQCIGNFSGACDSAGNTSCDITSSATFASSNEASVSITDAGAAEALAPTPEGSPAQLTCSDVDTTQNPAQTRVSDPAALVTVCSLDSVTSVEIVPATLTIAAGETQQLRLLANYTSCVSGQPQQLDVTESATWSSLDEAIAIVDENGELTAVNGGSTDVTGSFGGQDATITVDVKFAEIRSIEVIGPPVVVAGLDTDVRYQAIAILQDVDTGEQLGERILLDSPETPNAIWSSDSTDLDFADSLIGIASLAASAVPGAVTITAEHEGVTGSTVTKIVDFTALRAVEIAPEVVCIGDALAIVPFGDPVVQLESYAIVDYEDVDGVAQSCSLIATEDSEWSNTPAEITSSLLDSLLLGLLSPANDELLQRCEDGSVTLEAVNVGLDESPATVSNEEGTKGEVSGTSGNNLAGGTCVAAALGPNEVTGFSSVLVAANLQPICEALTLSNPPPSEDSCIPVYREPEQAAAR